MAREILVHVIGEYVAWVPPALVVIFSPAFARLWIWILGLRYPEARPALDETYRDALSWWRPLNFIFASLIFMVDAAKLAKAQAQAERDGRTRTTGLGAPKPNTGAGVEPETSLSGLEWRIAQIGPMTLKVGGESVELREFIRTLELGEAKIALGLVETTVRRDKRRFQRHRPPSDQ